MDLKQQYEQYLISSGLIYEKDFIPIIYWDLCDGKIEEKQFFIDFYVENDGKIEWIQCIPHSDLRPIKKYLYAQKISESSGIVFRGLTDAELKCLG